MHTSQHIEPTSAHDMAVVVAVDRIAGNGNRNVSDILENPTNSDILEIGRELRKMVKRGKAQRNKTYRLNGRFVYVNCQ